MYATLDVNAEPLELLGTLHGCGIAVILKYCSFILQTTNREHFQYVYMDSSTNLLPSQIEKQEVRTRLSCDEDEKGLLQAVLESHTRGPGQRSYYEL